RAEASPARRIVAESDPNTVTNPPWRAELKERVRRIKEKRATSGLAAPNSSPLQSPRAQGGEANPNRNPIVESALKRIRWASRETVNQRDGERERRRDGERESLPVSPSLRPSVSPSLRPSVSPSLRPSAPPPQSSTSEPSASGSLAGAPDKHVE